MRVSHTYISIIPYPIKLFMLMHTFCNIFDIILGYLHWHRIGLNSVGASISTTLGRGRKRGTLICIISGRGRKTVGASAPTAPISLAPLKIIIPYTIYILYSIY